MENLTWKKYVARRTSRKNISEPFVTINKRYGRIILNSTICNSVFNNCDYKYAQLFVGKTNDVLRKIKIQFTNTYDDNCVKLYEKGKYSNGAIFHCQKLINDIYRCNGGLKETVRFATEVSKEEGKDTLTFDILEGVFSV